MMTSATMACDYRRHDLLTLDPACELGCPPEEPLTDMERDRLRKWLAAGFPVVVRRPVWADRGRRICCGIPLPPAEGKKRMAFSVPLAAITGRSDLPALDGCLDDLPAAQRGIYEAFVQACRTEELTPRVFGSLAWQHLTGLPYRTDESDVDLLFRVEDREAFKRLAALLDRWPPAGDPGCDIEIMLEDGRAFAWREYASGASRILVRQADGVTLMPRSALAAPPAMPAGDRAERLARAAERALFDELATYPKPGLVSFADNGSHPDMRAGHFLASIAALRGYFRAVAEAGRQGEPLAVLRPLGLDAEQRMLAATGGVNTHRGAIFTLGLLVAAAGRQESLRSRLSLGQIVREQWGSAILEGRASAPDSHGLRACRSCGGTGAREEAAAGFPSVYQVALPEYRRASRLFGVGPRARLQAFFSLLATVHDTNLLHRGGAAGLAFAGRAARAFLRRGGVADEAWPTRAMQLHRAFIRRRLSPGGAADLLAATLFADRVDLSLPPVASTTGEGA